MPPLSSVEQRWFIGAHANVGGGYDQDPLSRIPLAWLQQKAQSVGLSFSQPVALSGTEWQTKPVDSYAKFLMHAYQVLTLGRRYWRPIGITANPVHNGWSFPVNETIDASVFRRFAACLDYRPQNLTAWSQRSKKTLVAELGDQLASLSAQP